MSTIQTYTFNNGFRVIYEKHYNNMNLSDMRLYVRLGSAHEPHILRGVSHLIEHMCFKGTTRLPTAKQITSIFDDMGAYLNATTTEQYTYYTVYTHRKNTSKSLQTLGDMLFNSVFDKDEFAKEIDVVVEENVKNNSDGKNRMFETLYDMMFDGTPYAYPVDTLDYHRGKSKKNLENRDMVYDTYQTFYVPQNMVLSIVTSLSFRTIMDMLKQTLFVKNPKFKTHRLPVLNDVPPTFFRPMKTFQMRIMNNGLNVAYIGIGFVVCSYFNKDDARNLGMLSTLMSGTFMSRLFYVLREKHGLTYTSNTKVHLYDNIGGFFISVTSDSSKLIKNGNEKGVLPVLVDLLNDLVENGITAKELEHGKKYFEGKQEVHSEKSNKQCAYNAFKLLMMNEEAPIPFNRVYETIEKKFTLKDMNAVIKKYFTPQRMFICINGGHLPSDETIHKVFAKFRT